MKVYIYKYIYIYTYIYIWSDVFFTSGSETDFISIFCHTVGTDEECDQCLSLFGRAMLPFVFSFTAFFKNFLLYFMLLHFDAEQLPSYVFIYIYIYIYLYLYIYIYKTKFDLVTLPYYNVVSWNHMAPWVFGKGWQNATQCLRRWQHLHNRPGAHQRAWLTSWADEQNRTKQTKIIRGTPPPPPPLPVTPCLCMCTFVQVYTGWPMKYRTA